MVCVSHDVVAADARDDVPTCVVQVIVDVEATPTPTCSMTT
jgi:hypothetical protein